MEMGGLAGREDGFLDEDERCWTVIETMLS
jgi:hypothetical protein